MPHGRVAEAGKGNKNICRTNRLELSCVGHSRRQPQDADEAAMIDLKAIQTELDHARLARIEAQAAGCEVEELIAAVQHFEPGKQRLVFWVECGEA